MAPFVATVTFPVPYTVEEPEVVLSTIVTSPCAAWSAFTSSVPAVFSFWEPAAVSLPTLIFPLVLVVVISTVVPPIVLILSVPAPLNVLLIVILPLGTTFELPTTPPTVTLPPVVFTVRSVPPKAHTLPADVPSKNAAFPVKISDCSTVILPVGAESADVPITTVWPFAFIVISAPPSTVIVFAPNPAPFIVSVTVTLPVGLLAESITPAFAARPIVTLAPVVVTSTVVPPVTLTVAAAPAVVTPVFVILIAPVGFRASSFAAPRFPIFIVFEAFVSIVTSVPPYTFIIPLRVLLCVEPANPSYFLAALSVIVTLPLGRFEATV